MNKENHVDAHSRAMEKYRNRVRLLARCAASKRQRSRSTAAVARLREYGPKDSPLLLLAKPEDARLGTKFNALGLGRDDFDGIVAKHVRAGYLPLGVFGLDLALTMADGVTPPKYQNDFEEFAKVVTVCIARQAATGKFGPEVEWRIPDEFRQVAKLR